MAEPFPGFTSLIRNLTINDGKPRTKHALKEGTTQTISHPPRHTGRPVLVTCIRRPEKRDQLSEAIQNLTGTTISHYRVIAKIGSGGMGVVYRAKDARLNRHVALKFVLNHGLTNESLYDCMLREARAASALNHPNVCAVYEIGDFRGLPFLVMELLKGQTLKERIKRPLTLERFLNIAIQICDGLDAVHSRAIVHRDIKPSNIFITAGDHVKIFDFSLAEGFPTSIPAQRPTAAHKSWPVLLLRRTYW